MSSWVIPIFAAAVGAIIQELSYWYQLRARLAEEAYSSLVKSRGYWVITALMILVTPLGVAMWVGDDVHQYKMRDLFLFGAAFPLIFKSGVSNLGNAGGTVKLGAENSQSVTSSYFDIKR